MRALVGHGSTSAGRVSSCASDPTYALALRRVTRRFCLRSGDGASVAWM